MSGNDLRNFNRLRTYILKNIKGSLGKSGRYKPTDGRMKLSVEYPDFRNKDGKIYYRIELDCSTLRGNKETYAWSAYDMDLLTDQIYRDSESWAGNSK